MLKEYFKQKGQAMVLYALMLPVMFTFVGVAADFGWWYFNESKLQNAADAAAIAGAKDIGVNGSKVELISSNDETFKKLKADHENEGNNNNEENIENSKDYTKIAEGYAKKNLSSEYQLVDELYEKDSSDSKYYAVTLTSKAEHLFSIMEKFGEMTTIATAVAKISKTGDGTDLYSELEKLKNIKVMDDWELTSYNKTEGYANMRTVRGIDRAVKYSDGDTYRTETIMLNGDGNGNTNREATGDKHIRDNFKNTKTLTLTDKDTGNKTSYTVFKTDDMFIDFRADINYNFTSDWDIGEDSLKKSVKYNWSDGIDSQKNWEEKYDYRILATINFDEPYPVRTGTKDSAGNLVRDSKGEELLETDPLYVRIESEPIQYTHKVQTAYSSVRQIVININESNFNTLTDKYRPLVIFYDGPQQIDKTSTIRQSQPVILNLNADFRAILFMPNSPVVINGNGNKFEGFVIAKEYKLLKTKTDFGSNYKEYKYTVNDNENKILINLDSDGVLPNSKIKSNESMVVNDSTGDYLLVNKSDLIYTSNYPSGVTNYIQVTNDSDVNDNNKYFIDKTKLKNASDYDTTTYIRPAEKSYPGTPVYVRTTISLGNGMTTKKLPNWWEVVKVNGDGTVYSIKNENDNFLLYGEGWRVISDISDSSKKYIAKKNNDFINSKDYIVITDEEGKSAYIHKNNAKNIYIKITNDKDINDVIYIEKSNTNVDLYFTEVTQTNTVTKETGLNTMYVDRKGNVKYKDGTVEKTKNNPNFKNEDEKKIYQATDFDLNSNSHYDYFKIPTLVRKDYLYLNDKNTDDMFFLTPRSKWIT